MSGPPSNWRVRWRICGGFSGNRPKGVEVADALKALAAEVDRGIAAAGR